MKFKINKRGLMRTLQTVIVWRRTVKLVRFRSSFAWYDLWVGAYWDRKHHVLYVCPLPMWLLEFRFPAAQWVGGQ